MLDDYTRGGQIFLHKIRMFRQVVGTSAFWSFIVGSIIVFYLISPKCYRCDWAASKTYIRALFVDSIWQITPKLTIDSQRREPKIEAFDRYGRYKEQMLVSSVLNHSKFKQAYNQTKDLIITALQYVAGITIGLVLLIFLLWSQFGRSARASKRISGSSIKTPKEVREYLQTHKLVSQFKIGDMPLVKDSETKHLLVTGSTGSGKTNLFNTLLPQVGLAKQPALVIDQTGEMIARYYTQARGDIIFNPLDSRSHAWDFWTDATDNTIVAIDTRLEKFAKILFSFGKKPHNSGDPFWQNSAETIFVSCVESLIRDNNRSFSALKYMLSYMPADSLGKKLIGTKGARYFSKNNKTTAESILSVMTTGAKPLNLLFDQEAKFSLREYFQQVNNGSTAWLFLSTAPSQREVTLPLLACLLELAISYLIEIGINEKRRMWFIIDELSALGRLDAFTILLSEARKYGGCVLAATQSVNQLFDNFGHYSGSTIADQFATKFIFRSSDPSTAKMISEIFGQVEYAVQQKNTSYGANEHRDGISYTEQEKRKSLITTNDLATLENLECFVSLPEPKIRIAKLQLKPVTNVLEKNQGFIPCLERAMATYQEELVKVVQPKTKVEAGVETTSESEVIKKIDHSLNYINDGEGQSSATHKKLETKKDNNSKTDTFCRDGTNTLNN